MKQLNRSLAISWLCLVCAVTPILKAQGQTTIFSDNFASGVIDTNKWTTSGNTVVESGGMMQVLTTVTDNGGILSSIPVPISPHGDITITRNALVHYANEYFVASMNVEFGNLGWAGVEYANYFYPSTYYGWEDRYGIYLSRNNVGFWYSIISSASDTNICEPISPIWDTWFNEKLVYSPDTGNLQYSINGQIMTNFFVGVMPPTNNPTIHFQFQAWGWWTGHEQLFSSFLVTQDIKQPAIVMQPTNQSVQANSTITFNVTAYGQQPLNYQWQFNGQNIYNATNATLTLNSVTAANSGGYSVIVSNPYGSVTSATASLAVLADGANGNTPNQISVSPIPPKPLNKDSLVVITHGWEPLQPNADLSWMTAMSNAIQSRVSSNWAITNYIWLQDAIHANPELVLAAAEIHGRLYGQQLAGQGWSHIHFIGHSAGAGLIENAAAEIPSSTTVQCTFLDPFAGLLLELQSEYGVDAHWADCYFTQDISGGFTGGGLTHAYNVDVDWLDPNHDTLIYGTALIAVSTQLSAASHGYPIDFYTQTAMNPDPSWCADAAGYGFAFSAEAGGETKWASHPVGNSDNPYVLCGPPGAIPSPTLPVAVTGIVIDQVSHAVSDTVSAVVNGTGFVLNSIWSALPLVKSGGFQPAGETSTNTPAWLAVGVSVTNAVNFVQFDAGFADTNSAQGLLTVYWNTNQIGMVDERVAQTNSQTYRFELPGTVSGGLYTLSFRLDSFENSSSIAVTNVATGFVGVTQPITLGISLTNGAPLLQLTAATNFTYLIQSSTNLVDWTPTALLLNTNGTAQFMDSAITNSSARYYRAVMP
jgi:hypothetical protein